MTPRRATSADVEGIAQVHVTAWEETYSGLLPASVIAAKDLGFRRTLWARLLKETPQVFVVEEAGRIVGFASGGPQKHPDLARQGYAAEIHALYVLRASQRQGHGRALFRAVVSGLSDMGFASLSLLVLDSNAPACAFYEAMGGAAKARLGDVLDDGTVVHDLAYVWDPLPI